MVCSRFEEISCRAYNPRWRWNPETRACEYFEYGGCEENANNFETIDFCERKCQPTMDTEQPDNSNRVLTWKGELVKYFDICCGLGLFYFCYNNFTNIWITKFKILPLEIEYR